MNSDELLFILAIVVAVICGGVLIKCMKYLTKKPSSVLNYNSELKKKFCAYFKSYLEEGFIKIVSSDESFVLCDLADTMYGAFYRIDEEKSVAVGIFVEPEQAAKISKKEGYFEELLLYYTENDALDNRFIFLNEDIAGKLRKLKENRVNNGQTKIADKNASKSDCYNFLTQTHDEYPKLLLDCPVSEDLQPLTTENTPHLIDESSGTVYFIIKTPCIIGRDRTACDIVLSYDTVGRKHAKITEINGDYIIEDLGSKHSTTVEYRSFKQHKTKTMLLVDGDTVKFSDKEFVFKNPKESKKKEKLGIYFSKELAELLNGGEFEELDDICVFAYKYLEKFFSDVMKLNLLDKDGGACIAIDEYTAVSSWSSVLGNFDFVYYCDGDIVCLYIYAIENIKEIFELILKELQSHIAKELYANELLGEAFEISLKKERSLKEAYEGAQQ